MHRSEVSLSRMLRNSRMSATHFACIAYLSNNVNVNPTNSIIIKSYKGSATFRYLLLIDPYLKLKVGVVIVIVVIVVVVQDQVWRPRHWPRAW